MIANDPTAEAFRQAMGRFATGVTVVTTIAGAYHTAKWAVEGFSESLRREVAPLGIKVTIIEPGAFRTDFNVSSMRETPPSADYQPTVGQAQRFFREIAGEEQGDPPKRPR